MIKKRPTTSLVELGRLAEYLDRDGPKVAGYRADLETIAGAVSRGRDTAAILGLIREQVGLGTAMDTLDGAGAAKTAAAHGDDLLALEQVATVHPDPATFEAWLREILSRPPDPSGVTLSTIHRVKGREWDRVVVLGASGGLFPHRLAEDLEEERRIFHVGITRGRAQIVVVGDKDDPSPFLAEAAGTASHDRPLRRTGVTAGRGALVPPRPGSGRSSKTGAEAKAERLAVIWEPHQEVALAALRAWRIGKARSTGAPAFTVFNDATLHAIVAAWPTSLNALSWISGVGPAKLERHGDEVLAVLDGVTVPIGQRGSPAHGPMPPAVSP